MEQYDLLNELANAIGTGIGRIAPALGRELHTHREAYHQGLNLQDIAQPGVMHGLGKMTRETADWLTEGKGSEIAAKAGTIGLLTGAAAIPTALYATHVARKGIGVQKAKKAHVQTIKEAQLSSRNVLQNIAKITTELTKANLPAQTKSTIAKHLLGSTKELETQTKVFEKAKKPLLGGANLAAAGAAMVGVPLAIGAGLHIAKATSPLIRAGLSSIGKWVHSWGTPYGVPTPAEKVYSEPTQEIKRSVHQHHIKHYY